MRTDMVILDICKFLHCLIKIFLFPKFIQIYTFILQRIKIPLHWCIIVWISGFTHTLDYMDRFAELHKCLGCILGTLIAVKDQFPFDLRLGIQGFLQCPYCKITGDTAVGYAGNHTPVIQVYDCAVVSHFVVCKKQICKISTPFLVNRSSREILF